MSPTAPSSGPRSPAGPAGHPPASTRRDRLAAAMVALALALAYAAPGATLPGNDPCHPPAAAAS